MQTSLGARTEPEPATAEDAVLAVMMSIGRRMRHRRPDDVVDFSALPILKVLHHQGPTRLSGLAGELGLDASTVSRHVRHLEDKGLLVRTDDPDDGRASRVALSDQGGECLHAIGRARRAEIEVALTDWSAADREQLRVLLHRLQCDLAASDTAAAPVSAASTPQTPHQENS